MAKKDIKSMTYGEICDIMKLGGFQSFRAKQLFGWLCKVDSFEKMTNLPKDLIAFLDKDYYIPAPVAKRKLVSKNDCTV